MAAIAGMEPSLDDMVTALPFGTGDREIDDVEFGPGYIVSSLLMAELIYDSLIDVKPDLCCNLNLQFSWFVILALPPNRDPE